MAYVSIYVIRFYNNYGGVGVKTQTCSISVIIWVSLNLLEFWRFFGYVVLCFAVLDFFIKHPRLWVDIYKKQNIYRVGTYIYFFFKKPCLPFGSFLDFRLVFMCVDRPVLL